MSHSKKLILDPNLKHAKISFPPISNPDTKILILGSMPGDKSLELGEYYGHARNRFWKIIASITGSDLQMNYSEKKELLLKNKIAVWDIAHKANRIGSLDSALKFEEPNDLEGFIAKHEYLKVIGFNGIKAMTLYDKYFERKSGIVYILLPSSSPANAGIRDEGIFEKWKFLLINGND